MIVHPISDEELINYAAGELTGDDFLRVVFHVSNCVECSTTVNRFRRVRSVLTTDDSVTPPVATLARAQAIFSTYRPQFRNSWGASFLRSRLVLTTAAVAALLICAFALNAFLLQPDISPESPLYPAKVTVEGIRAAVSRALGGLGIFRAPSPEPIAPAETQTAIVETPAPVESRPSSGQPQVKPTDVPPGQTRIPPGQTQIPPGQTRVPPGQVNTPPGQARTATRPGNTPPGQVNTPPGQVNTPSGQPKVPPSQANTPASKAPTPASQLSTPTSDGLVQSSEPTETPMLTAPTTSQQSTPMPDNPAPTRIAIVPTPESRATSPPADTPATSVPTEPAPVSSASPTRVALLQPTAIIEPTTVPAPTQIAILISTPTIIAPTTPPSPVTNIPQSGISIDDTALIVMSTVVFLVVSVGALSVWRRRE